MSSGSLIKELNKHTDHIRSIAFSPNGRFIITGSADKTAIIWNFYTGSIIHVINNHKDIVRSVSFSADGRRFATSSSDKTAFIYDFMNGGIEK